MIIERATSAGSKRAEIEDIDTPLESILKPEPNEQVCQLRDSPYRILRVSERFYSDFQTFVGNSI